MHMTKLIYRWWESIKRCRKRGGKFCITDTKLLMHIMLFNIPGEWSYSTDLMWKEQEVSCNSNWCGQECWCKEGWRDLKWFMVSAWISLNVEPKTYRTGEDTATSQLREQWGKPPPCCSVFVLYNAIIEDLIIRLGSVIRIVNVCLILNWFIWFI